MLRLLAFQHVAPLLLGQGKTASEPTAPTLDPLTLNNTTAYRYTPWSANVSGKTEASVITATSSDGTSLTFGTGVLSGTFLTSGAKTITMTETLAGANGNPHVSPASVTVMETADKLFIDAPLTGQTGNPTLFSYKPLQGESFVTFNAAASSAVRITDDAFVYCTGNSGSHVASLIPIESDVDVEAPIRLLGAGVPNQFVGLIAKGTGAGGLTTSQFYYAAYVQGQGLLYGKKAMGASSSTTVSTHAHTLIGTPLLRFRVREVLDGNGAFVTNELTAWIGDTEFPTQTDATIQGPGRAGYRLGGAAGSATAGLQIGHLKAAYTEPVAARSLPAATEIPPTLVAPWQPTLGTTYSTTAFTDRTGTGDGNTFKSYPEDHILIRKANCSVHPLPRPIKVTECEAVRVEGVDMSGFELTIRARKFANAVGCKFDGNLGPEGDGIASGGLKGFEPIFGISYCRIVNTWGTDLDHYTSTGVDNVTNVETVQQIGSNPRRFRITLKQPFPEGLPSGAISPVRRITVAENTYEGVNLPLQGYNWNFEADWVDSTGLIYEGDVQALGGTAWDTDVGRNAPVFNAGTGTAPAGTGGRSWLYKTGKGQHNDAAQIEDNAPVTRSYMENTLVSGTYQIDGNTGSPSRPFKRRNVHGVRTFRAPQDPNTKFLYVKDAEGVTAPPSGFFENVYYEQIFGRSVASAVHSDEQQPYTMDTVDGRPRVTYTGPIWFGSIIDGPPPIDFAPDDLIGTNWDPAQANWIGKTPIAPGSITDITIAWETLTAGMVQGDLLGVISVQSNTQMEVAEVSFVSHGADAAPRIMGFSATGGTDAYTSTGQIRRRLVRGTQPLAAGATYQFRLRAELEDHPDVFLEKDFSITVPS